MKQIEKYLEEVVKVKLLGKLSTEDWEQEGLSGEMVFVDGRCSDIFISHIDYVNWLEKEYEANEKVAVNVAKESEDERRIREALINIFEHKNQSFMDELTNYSGDIKIEEVLSWLEKQSDSAWSNEDEYILGETIQHLEELIRIDKAKHFGDDVQYYQRDIDWLKSLKDRVQSQPKQEWSEEDSKTLQRIIDFLWYNRKGDTDTIYQQEQDIEWLKSLRPQLTNWNSEDRVRLASTIQILDYAKSLGAYNQYGKESIEKNIEWLKSLKQHIDWKPTQEEVMTFEHFVRSIGESGYASPYENSTKQLQSLLQKLKTLIKDE